MEQVSKILQQARQRAEENSLPYAGALTPQEAQQILEQVAQARLIDVRSSAEIDLVGRIPQAVNIEWAFYPGWKANPDFAAQLKAQVDPENLVLFICRSGARSHNAARLATAEGYAEAYNIIEGFEGAPDPVHRRRGTLDGWKAADLPWTNG